MLYRVRTDSFEGPFDLLLYLVSRQKVDIGAINITQIADQYLAEVGRMQNLDLDVASDFLLVASTLLEIKAQSLLPREHIDVEDDIAELAPSEARDMLVERLLEYKRIKDATETLKEREEEAELVYYKEADASVAKLKEQPPQELEDLLQGITMDDLYQAFRQVMARKETKEDKVRSSFRSVQKDLFTVGEKMEYIRDMLILHPHEKTAFHTIFRRNAGKMERVVTFLALLELIKQKEVQITQEKNFGEIFISRYDEGGAE